MPILKEVTKNLTLVQNVPFVISLNNHPSLLRQLYSFKINQSIYKLTTMCKAQSHVWIASEYMQDASQNAKCIQSLKASGSK